MKMSVAYNWEISNRAYDFSLVS